MKKMWQHIKAHKKAYLIGFIIFLVIGWIMDATGYESEYDKEQRLKEEQIAAEQAEAEARQEALDNLQVGQPADFSNYTVTVNSVNQSDMMINANVTVAAKTDITFKSSELNELKPDGKSEGAETFQSVNIKSGENQTFDLSYKDYGGDALEWKNGSDKAVWHFTPAPENAYDPEKAFDKATALTALENYGKAMYPYGFELHTAMGEIITVKRDDGGYLMRYTCDVTNAFGATAEDVICDAVVTGVGTNPLNYTVTQFNVSQ